MAKYMANLAVTPFTYVTDDEASIVEEYTEEKKKYWKKVGDIEESYGTGGMISL